ncbi:response regulator transcription factor [Segetibacter sp. 3557_3]|uniref:response regulator transcription factor n=1 Tax=Segetibacter sp. 3557_3 TaxID=2547429 RepID=UPI0010588F39|nr:response regulator transcription factor [Segetibacter sp. 3557_3]TDH27927.1 response regulator transcription factor [Segetibacter sp. 3557_3]
MEESRILIVEDEKKIADTLNFGLSENGYHTEVAYDGNLGYQLFQANTFDLTVLDINIPGMNGYELCKLIRAENREMPIIMLTAMTSIDDKIEGYDAGADDYIIKPFEFKELLMKIRVLLRRTMSNRVPPGTILKAADLELNIDSKEVKRGNTTINLTAKEFQLLEYLLRNKNKVLSRSEIAINVWEIDFDTNTNVIDVYINYVRNKIDKPFSQKLIHTQVGMGYILKEN